MSYSEEWEALLTEAKSFHKYFDELLQSELMVLQKARIVSFQSVAFRLSFSDNERGYLAKSDRTQFFNDSKLLEMC